jgi:hypothetical protein
MEHVFTNNTAWLEDLADAQEQDLSPEDFLLMLEDALEQGEMTMSELRTMLSDYNRRS